MFKYMLVCLVCCLTYVDAIGADIFGLKKGMTIEEIRALGFGTIEMGLDNDYFGVVNPKMPKNANYVSFVISPQGGLLYVSFSWDERTNSFDTLKRKYGEICDILIRTYGKEGFGLSESGMRIVDIAEQLSVAKDPSFRELWRKSDFDADNKWQLENLRLELSGYFQKRCIVLTWESLIAYSHLKGVHMPQTSPYKIVLSDEEYATLSSRSRQYTLPYYQVIRAKMILLAAQGEPNDQIADRLDVPRKTVSRWRKRFCESRLAGLEDQPRSGRPSDFSPSGGGTGQSHSL